MIKNSYGSFSGWDRSTPPDWRIKHLTQNFINSTMQRNTSVFKIRSQNQTAHTLAKQAFVGIQSHPTNLSFSCSNRSHVLQCPLRDALTSVVTDSVTILSASCCWNKSVLVVKKKVYISIRGSSYDHEHAHCRPWRRICGNTTTFRPCLIQSFGVLHWVLK